MTWPPRWTGAHFKQPVARGVTKGLKREAHKSNEKSKMDEARKRDKYCRFPMCGCKRFKLRLDVCHTVHRGMGGNPKEDRSAPELLILLCSARHRENVVSLDKGTIRIRPLTKEGTAGPCAFDIDRRSFGSIFTKTAPAWLEVGRETALHQFEPFTQEQSNLLTMLKGMEQ